MRLEVKEWVVGAIVTSAKDMELAGHVCCLQTSNKIDVRQNRLSLYLSPEMLQPQTPTNHLYFVSMKVNIVLMPHGEHTPWRACRGASVLSGEEVFALSVNKHS